VVVGVYERMHRKKNVLTTFCSSVGVSEFIFFADLFWFSLCVFIHTDDSA